MSAPASPPSTLSKASRDLLRPVLERAWEHSVGIDRVGAAAYLGHVLGLHATVGDIDDTCDGHYTPWGGRP